MPLILLVDDHPLFRDGFAHMVSALRPAWQLSFADHAARAVAEIEALKPDLAILDIARAA